MDTKTCAQCKEILSLDYFSKGGKNCKDGLQTYCKACANAWAKKYNDSGRSNIARRKWTRAHPYQVWSMNTLCQHRVHGLQVFITRPELTLKARQTRYCQVCGCELDWTPLKGKTQRNSPTLDRINNEVEMRLDNVQIVCFRCNAVKRDFTMDELIEWCEKVIKYRR